MRLNKIIILITEKGNEGLRSTRQWLKEEREILDGINLCNWNTIKTDYSGPFEEISYSKAESKKNTSRTFFWSRKYGNSQRITRTSQKERVASLNELPPPKTDTNDYKDENNSINGL